VCGIAGLVLPREQGQFDIADRLRAMQAAMIHRGPDDSGMFIASDRRMGLVNRRLAIRDLSPAAHMPMINQDGRVIISYNGEIYNAAELRPRLEGLGFRFKSRSDTEVILHGFEAWGRQVVEHLRGMFAFALFDFRDPKPKVLLARDRLGIKPLYYSERPSGLAFASELSALLRSGMLDRAISASSMATFLQLGSIPGPSTAYEDAKLLPPASTLEWADGRSSIDTFWELPYPTGAPTLPDVAERVRESLFDAVRCHMISDVPLGLFLSGGLDSTVIATVMKAGGADPIRTCSISFPEIEYDEGPFARAAASAVGSEHFEDSVTGADVEPLVELVLAVMDQPTVDGVNTFLVSRTARRAGLKVAMSGLGGDELFGGYANTFSGIPRLFRLLRLAWIPGGRTAGRFASKFGPAHVQAKFKDALARPPSLASAYFAIRGLFAPTEVRKLLTPMVVNDVLHEIEIVSAIEERAEPSPHTRDDLFGWASRAELRSYTHNQLLRDTDVMSMSHSLEVRVPLLDDRLVETVLALPSSAHAGGGVKPLLLRAVGDLLPSATLSRPRRMGFTLPFDAWLRGGLSELVAAALSTSSLREVGLLQPSAVSKIREGFERGDVHWSRLWSLVVLQLWCARAAERFVLD
jgi:asparagine synthase (glutamine-hydrolysing)